MADSSESTFKKATGAISEKEIKLNYEFFSVDNDENQANDDMDVDGEEDFCPKKNSKTYVRIFNENGDGGVKEEIEVVNGEFVYSGVEMVAFMSVLSLRTHELEGSGGKRSVANYKDESSNVYVVAEKVLCQRLLQNFVNLTQNSIKFSTIEPTDNVENTVKNLMQEMNRFKEIEALMKIGMDFINEKSLFEAFSIGEKTVIRINSADLNLSTLIKFISEIVFEYTTYQENLLFTHSMNNHLAMVMYCFNCILYSHFILPRCYFVASEQLVIHSFVSLFMDLATDRCSKELFIKERSKTAANIVHRLKKAYPQLAKITSEDEWGSLPEKFYREVSQEPVNLLPHILTYSMCDEKRIKSLYNHLRKSLSEGNNKRFFTADEFYDILTQFSADMECKMYSQSTFMSILPKLRCMLVDLNDDESDKVLECLTFAENNLH